MKTVNLYEVDEEVLIKVKVAGVEIRKGEVWYRVKDPVTSKCFDYLFEPEKLIPAEN